MTTQERYGLPEELSLTVKVDAEIAKTVYWECNPVWDGSEPDGSGRTTAVNHIMRQLKDQIGGITKLPKAVGERAKILYPESRFVVDCAVPHAWAEALYEESGPHEYDFRNTGGFVWVYRKAQWGDDTKGCDFGRPGPITPEALNACIDNSIGTIGETLWMSNPNYRKKFPGSLGPLWEGFSQLKHWECTGAFNAIADMKDEWNNGLIEFFHRAMNVHVNGGE